MDNNVFKLINRLDEIQRTGKYTVFYRYSGHVDYFNIEIYIGDWIAGKEALFNETYRVKQGGIFEETNVPYEQINVGRILEKINSLIE